MRLPVLAATFVALLLTPSAAAAKAPATPWATVNLCDTARRPDTIGIRTSVPNIPKGTTLALRFRVQFRGDDGWQDVKGAGSAWRPSGSVRGLPFEYGWSFTFAHPTSPVTLRGMVQLRWRRGATIVREQELSTEPGHRSSAGADPADFSAATCTLGG